MAISTVPYYIIKKYLEAVITKLLLMREKYDLKLMVFGKK